VILALLLEALGSARLVEPPCTTGISPPSSVPDRRRRGEIGWRVKLRTPKAATATTKPRSPQEQRTLLVTMTKEPFQPVRFYYSIPTVAFVTQRIKALRCMLEGPTAGCWQWLFKAETAQLRFIGSYDDVPVERRPIVLGWMRFPQSGVMTLESTSVMRAIEAARFFAPVLGPEVVAMRFRMINRFFAADEGPQEELVKLLDRDVTVIDPRFSERRAREWLENVRTQEDLERAAAADLQRRIAEREDVPMVEDAPLAPEEETPDFQHLQATLGLRNLRAAEHWQGNTQITLSEIIQRTVKAQLERGR
jgi:hypothetical protein